MLCSRGPEGRCGIVAGDGFSSRSDSSPFRYRFREAASDYAYLLDRGYGEKPTRRLVGDRYRLTGAERTALLRGVYPAEEAERRRKRLTVEPTGVLWIDGYNVLFTIRNVRHGRPVVLARDGFLRDVAGSRKRPSDSCELEALIRELCGVALPAGVQSVVIFLDQFFPGSGQHAARLRELGFRNRRGSIPTEVVRAPHVDRRLAAWVRETRGGSQSPQGLVHDGGLMPKITQADERELRLPAGASCDFDSNVAGAPVTGSPEISGVLAGSDSEIADRCDAPLFDHARYVLAGSRSSGLGRNYIDIRRLLGEA